MKFKIQDLKFKRAVKKQDVSLQLFIKIRKAP